MRALLVVIPVAAIAGTAVLAGAQQPDFSKVTVRSQKLAEGVYMLEGAGGNIGLSVGKDGGFLIDDQFAPMSAKIRTAARKVGATSIRFVLNTHWHGDHTGGNENLGKAGALIVAHDNVRKRMSTEQFIAMKDMKVPPSPAAALPVVTFTSDVSFHLNGDEIRVFHPDPAHTDGDAVIHLVKANVIHMGDTYMTMSYPFVDGSSGGTYAGFIAVADRVLAIANDTTKIIPGHGELSDKARLKAWRDMLVTIRERVARAIKEGKTLEQTQALKLTAEWDAAFGVKFIKPEQIIQTVYEELKSKKK
jgi:cyclase